MKNGYAYTATTEVVVEDFPVLHLDGDDDLAAHCNDCNLYRTLLIKRSSKSEDLLLFQPTHCQHVQPHLTRCIRIEETITMAISSNGELDKRSVALDKHRVR